MAFFRFNSSKLTSKFSIFKDFLWKFLLFFWQFLLWKTFFPRIFFFQRLFLVPRIDEKQTHVKHWPKHENFVFENISISHRKKAVVIHSFLWGARNCQKPTITQKLLIDMITLSICLNYQLSFECNILIAAKCRSSLEKL